MDANSLPTSIVTFLPILVGLTSRFIGIFVSKPKELEKRINLVESSITEKLALKLTAVLNHLRSIAYTDELLRGDDRESVDLVGDYSNELNRLFKIVNKIGSLNAKFRICHGTLLITTLVGILLFLISFISDIYNFQLLVSASAIIAVQVVVVMYLYFQINRLGDYEQFI